jgi:hypothetical protein
MLAVRHSPERNANAKIRDVPARRGESNGRWLSRVGATDGILLLGGSALADFRIRVAQSHLRRDLCPSFWSLAGILRDGKTFDTVPLDFWEDTSQVPGLNGIQRCRIAGYDDPDRYPNIAVLSFTRDTAVLARHAESVRGQRSVLDLPSLMLPWLGFVWGAGRQGNPLFGGTGVPSAAFVETVYALAGIDLTPGVSSESSCPEAIWQAAKWWQGYYAEAAKGPRGRDATPMVPAGSFATRQREAAVVDPKTPRRGVRGR